MQRFTKLGRPMAVLALSAVAAMVIAACGDDNNDSGSSSTAAGTGTTTAPAADKGTINVGSIGAVTGPIPLGEAMAGAKAYFDEQNAAGGINGYKVNFIIKDDKTDPALSARAARELDQSDKVVALVGDLTLVGCAVNRKFLEKAELRSVMAGGATPECFQQPNVSPVNTGPVGDFKVALTYAHDTLGKAKNCAIFTSQPIPYAEEVISWYKDKYGEPLTMADQSLTQKSNLDALFATAKSKGCETISTDGTANQTGPMVQARDKQGLGSVPLIFMGAQYNPALAEALGSAKEVYATAELLPLTEPDPKLDPMLAAFKKYNVQLDGLSQMGWVSAWMFSEIAKTIKGEITRESVNAALLAATSIDNDGWAATPYAFGPDQAHNSNKGAKMMKIEGGKWIVATPDWVVWG